MTTNVITCYHTGSKNMKTVKKESEKVWRCNRTKKYSQGVKSPYVSSILIAGMGDPIPDVKFEKAKKKTETKAVKPKENK